MEYLPGDGRRQNLHTKQWQDEKQSLRKYRKEQRKTLIKKDQEKQKKENQKKKKQKKVPKKKDLKKQDLEKRKNIGVRKKIGIKDKDSKTLSNKKWLEAEFSSDKKLKKHLADHLKEYTDITDKEFINTARKLLAAPLSEDVEGFMSEAGFIFKYKKSTNDFAIGRPDGKISTLFKPTEGYKYYQKQIKRFKGGE